jgi:hypothetical protein
MASTIYNKTTGQVTLVINDDLVPETEFTASIPGSFPGPGWKIDLITLQPVRVSPYDQPRRVSPYTNTTS